MSFEKSIRPRRETAESKAEATKRISQEITKTEADIRNEKTLRLRAERLAAQECQPKEVQTKRVRKSAKPN